jgi:Ca-activated chloride channel family protein
MITRSLTALVLLALIGCSDSTSPSAAPTRMGSVGVGQGGAQDIAEFRAIVAAGHVPAPSTLDAVGFFAEHALTLPPADCGDTICAHASLAVARRFDRSAWTMAFIALNSSIDPSTLTRPPVHTVFVIEHTTRTASIAAGLFDGLHHFTGDAQAGDRVSVIEVRDRATTLTARTTPDDPTLATLATTLAMPGGTTAATYEGLALAAELLTDPSWSGHRHVVMLTSGATDAGLGDPDRVVALASSMLEGGTTLSVIGGGAPYLDALPIAIGELGGGAYYFAQSASDLAQILDVEGRTSLFPIARDFSMRITPAPGYTIGRTYGAARAQATSAEADLGSPMLLLGQRTGPSDVANGRRGGGGGFFVELLTLPLASVSAGAPAFTLETSYVDSATGTTVTRARTVNNPLALGAVPTGNLPEFSDVTQAEAFMMLNMYLSMRTATTYFADGDCARAMGTLDMIEPTIEWWQGSALANPDTQADWTLALSLRDVLGRQCDMMGAVMPIAPRSPGLGCFMD